ncbi:uncharacterized protein NFIA_106830 [Aspergillus fischeri NRRL 181]|uniref:Uncharacterized protein n=1 Tax=Neosartorya fischeri (strain ATCC 1020 / DSM 3700 / CBS 544.65 / FGSC A1164 / JCM 1740 / NRRL 181 / WB 181) TaxID=331117 RepID=A1CX42_NEOFI|nr:uncharacterized protein NFIA_106830 [Aspergillus fischeri NRRL 181]EAW25194.1 hypothetical protein NFIA_106830 [Aspergillus fischeri NRRL 181]
MDPISAVGSIISVLSFAGSFFNARRVFRGSGPVLLDSSQLTKWEPPLLVKLFAPQLVPQLKSLYEVVLSGSNDVLDCFRSSYCFDCNMVAVAGAIIAQIAMTSLTLPFLSQTHWVSRAFFITSVVSGCLAVYFAVMTQKTVAMLYTARETRAWLAGPLPDEILRAVHQSESMLDRNPSTELEQVFTEPEQVENVRRMLTTRNPSVYAVLVMGIPAFMLNLSLGTLLVGLGVYLGFIWTRHLDTQSGPNDSRNVFVFYIVGIFTMIATYFIPNALKDRETEQQGVRKRILQKLEKVENGHQNIPGLDRQEVLNEHNQRLTHALEASVRSQEALLNTVQDLLRHLDMSNNQQNERN